MIATRRKAFAWDLRLCNADDTEDQHVAQKGDSDANDSDGDNDEAEEIDVEDMSGDFDSDSSPVVGKDMSARRRLEELLEERRAARDLEDFEDYDY